MTLVRVCSSWLLLASGIHCILSGFVLGYGKSTKLKEVEVWIVSFCEVFAALVLDLAVGWTMEDDCYLGRVFKGVVDLLWQEI